MLSLSTDAVKEHWLKLNPELSELFERIEKTEDWVLDNHPDIADRLAQFGLALSDPEATLRLADADKNELLFFLVYISSSKAFRVIQWMDETQNMLGTKTLQTLLEQDGKGVFANIADPLLAGTMIQRLRVIQNTPFFEKLLDPSLLDSIIRAINNYREERESHAT